MSKLLLAVLAITLFMGQTLAWPGFLRTPQRRAMAGITSVVSAATAAHVASVQIQRYRNHMPWYDEDDFWTSILRLPSPPQPPPPLPECFLAGIDYVHVWNSTQSASNIFQTEPGLQKYLEAAVEEANSTSAYFFFNTHSSDLDAGRSLNTSCRHVIDDSLPINLSIGKKKSRFSDIGANSCSLLLAFGFIVAALVTVIVASWRQNLRLYDVYHEFIAGIAPVGELNRQLKASNASNLELIALVAKKDEQIAIQDRLTVTKDEHILANKSLLTENGAQISDLVRQMEAAERAAKEQKDTMTALQSKLLKRNEELSRLEQSHCAKQAQLASDYDAKIEALERRVLQQNSRTQELKQDINKLEEGKTATEVQISNLDAKIHHFNIRDKQQNLRIEDLKSEIRELKQKSAFSEEENAKALDQQRQEIETKHDTELKKSFKDSEEKIVDLQKVVRNTRGEASEERKKTAEKEAKAVAAVEQRLRRDVETKEMQIAKLARERDKMTAELSSANALSAEHEQESQRLKDTLTGLQSNLAALEKLNKDNVERLDSEIQQLKDKTRAKDVQISTLQQEKNNLDRIRRSEEEQKRDSNSSQASSSVGSSQLRRLARRRAERAEKAQQFRQSEQDAKQDGPPADSSQVNSPASGQHPIVTVPPSLDVTKIPLYPSVAASSQATGQPPSGASIPANAINPLENAPKGPRADAKPLHFANKRVYFNSDAHRRDRTNARLVNPIPQSGDSKRPFHVPRLSKAEEKRAIEESVERVRKRERDADQQQDDKTPK